MGHFLFSATRSKIRFFIVGEKEVNLLALPDDSAEISFLILFFKNPGPLERCVNEKGLAWPCEPFSESIGYQWHVSGL